MEENYKFLIETEWKDIHHSRLQEWSALGVIAAIHVGLIQTIKLINTIGENEKLLSYFSIAACLIALLFCLIGVLMTCRHRRLMWIKTNWIFEAEDKLGLVKKSNDDKGIIPEDYMKVKSVKYNEIIKREAKKNDKSKFCIFKRASIWNRLMWPRSLSTSWIIIMFYFLLSIIDNGFLIFSLIRI